jgi:hypothetical protein
MSSGTITYDVFISYPFDLSGQAKVIINKFIDVGLNVFHPSELNTGVNIVEETWQALAESWALVALISPGTMPPSVAVEIGAASAWQKPIYILIEGKGEFHVPVYFSKYQVYRTSEVDVVIDQIVKALSPMDDEIRETLISAYSELGIPTDRLLMQPMMIEKLNDTLWKNIHIRLPSERIMQELLRLRKQRELPRFRKKQ